MKLGCHAVLFAKKLAENPQEVIQALKGAGAEGAEIGARFFGVENSDLLKKLLDENELLLSGLHVGVLLTDLLDRPESCKEQLMAAAKFLLAMPEKNIIMSGALPQQAMSVANLGDDRLCDPALVAQIARTLGDFAIELQREYGVRLHYHNHDWEFRNDAAVFHALLEFAPALCFALDLGWAAVGSGNLDQVLDACAGRIHYVHLRDYDLSVMAGCGSFEERQNAYLPIGRGQADYPTLLPRLKEILGSDGWAIVEYETGEIDAKRYAHALEYLRGLG